MTWDVLKAHLDALDVQLQLFQVQVQALRHVMEPMFAPKATPSLEPRCAGIPADRCALQSEDGRIARGSFGNPHAWQCVGCRYVEGSS
jgi:hypothetical protein